MEYGDKVGQCESCGKDETLVQYSDYFNGWLCETCWDYIAEQIITGE